MADVSIQPITEAELSQILSGKTDTILNQDKPVKTEDKPNITEKDIVPTTDIDDSFNWKDLQKLGDKKEEEEEEEPKPDVKPKAEPKVDVKPDVKADVKPGRPASFVSLVNDMIEAKELFGYEDGEVKTAEDARELIRLNLAQLKEAQPEEAFKEKIKTYSPQIQAIIDYADKGGEDVSTLMSAIAQYEETSNFDIESEDGQIKIIEEYNKLQGLDDDYNKEEIETLKDVKKLKDRAKRLLPKLEEMAQQRIAYIQEEQNRMAQQIQAYRDNYKKTIHATLQKDTVGDIKLGKQEKSLIWNGLTEDKYVNVSGQRTNAFWKKLEDLQAGDKADYDHFLSIVYHALDKQGYQAKIQEKIKTDEAVVTARKLKIADTKPSSDDTLDPLERKPVISSGRFKRPVSF